MTKMVVQKIYIDEDPNISLEHEKCPACSKIGKTYNLRYMFLNLQEAVYKCSSPFCMFPYKGFKFKNYKDMTVYRYEILSSDDEGGRSNWIDSLPISPVKESKETKQGLDFLDVASLDTIVRIKNSNAMDQLQSELNDILSSHCSDLGSFDTKGDTSDQNEVKVESSKPVETARVMSNNEKPRKLSKCYEFIEAKSSFKVPTQPVKESLHTRKMHLSNKNHQKHRSPRKQRKMKVSSEPTGSKVETKNRSEALSFLNHIKNFNKTDVATVNDEEEEEMPITIEVMAQDEVETPENIVVKVESTSFSYYGDS